MLKSFILVLLVSTSLLNTHTADALPSPTVKYEQSAVLIPNEMAIYWNITEDHKFVLEVHSKADKFVGLGFSTDDTQTNADVFVAWVFQDGIGHFSDRHRKNGGDLIVDKRHNWFIDDVKLNTDFMILKVHRNVKVCDQENQDIDIHQGLMNIVYHYGVDFPNETALAMPWNLKQLDILNGASEGECEADPTPVVYEFNPTGYYSNQADLIDGVFRFYWNFTETDIIGEIHCKTKGWVGFGLSPNGKMDQSDVVIGWISDDGKVEFTDRHIDGREVLVDDSQDWHLLASKEENGFTVFKFTRKILSCDPQDKIIESGSPYFIYAYGTSDPKPGSDISYHGAQNRGTRQIVVISGAVNKEEIVENVETMDFLIENVIIPPDETTYYCKLFKVPDELAQKRHIVKWELLMPKLNVINIHHVFVYECPENLQINAHPDGHCFVNPVKIQCNIVSFGWAVGADYTHFFPPETGYPIGGDADFKYFYFELHYDNPEMKLGYIDSMGLRYHITKNLRPKELGILTVGTGVSDYAIAIPPGSDFFELTTYCFQKCTQTLPQDITVILAMPHTHLAGIGIYTKIIRNGTDIGYLHKNKYYDFNFQSVFRLDPPVALKPGDELMTKCLYKTKDRNRFTFGGESTQDEMCYHFFTYYPRVKGFSRCLSKFTLDSLLNLHKELARENYTTISETAANDPFNYQIIKEGLQQLKTKTSATPGVHKAFADFLNYTDFTQICNNDFSEDKLKKIVPLNTFVEEDICKDSRTTTTATKTSTVGATTSGSSRTRSSSALIPGVLAVFLAMLF